MDIQLAVLRARREVLQKPLPPRIVEEQVSWVSDDPFSYESRGFYAMPGLVRPEDGASTSDDKLSVQLVRSGKKKKRPSQLMSPGGKEKSGRVEKPERKTTKARFVPNWTPEMDKVLRKSLRKWGWGSWTRIERSGKLPKEYTRKIIARRVKILGFSREQFVQDGTSQKHIPENAKVRKYFR